MSDTIFPFELDDLEGWACVRTDGTVFRVRIGEPLVTKKTSSATLGNVQGWESYYKKSGSLTQWCQHDPILPVWKSDDEKIEIYVADSAGTNKFRANFDLVIDGGNNVPYITPTPVLRTLNLELVDRLIADTLPPDMNDNTLRINWPDRAAPPVYPEFWINLAAYIREQTLNRDKPFKVMTSCQGGHGRSGTAAVCLMMAFTEYDALEAITHLRAVHCGRAIESAVQHDYINWMAETLKRNANARDAENVTSFRKRFLEVMNPSPEFRDRVSNTKVTEVEPDAISISPTLQITPAEIEVKNVH